MKKTTWYMKKVLDIDSIRAMGINPVHWGMLGDRVHKDDAYIPATVLGIGVLTMLTFLYTPTDWEPRGIVKDHIN
jgi:hypothetical protein